MFQAYGRYYDLLYRDKDYQAESEYIAELLTLHGTHGKELLEYGSGTGRHANFMVEKGYRVFGVEKSAEMISMASVNDSYTIVNGDIRTYRLDRKFDAVISLFHVMSYQTENEDVLSVFNRAHEHLKPGGLFVFDFWYTPAVYTQKPVPRIKEMSDTDTRILRIAVPDCHYNKNLVDVRYSIFVIDIKTDKVDVIKETHTLRHFTLPEIGLFAEMTGFCIIGSEEFLTRKKPDIDTWGVCMILQKQ
jgi:SAM-dependent methyltransferase